MRVCREAGVGDVQKGRRADRARCLLPLSRVITVSAFSTSPLRAAHTYTECCMHRKRAHARGYKREEGPSPRMLFLRCDEDGLEEAGEVMRMSECV